MVFLNLDFWESAIEYDHINNQTCPDFPLYSHLPQMSSIPTYSPPEFLILDSVIEAIFRRDVSHIAIHRAEKNLLPPDSEDEREIIFERYELVPIPLVKRKPAEIKLKPKHSQLPR